MRAGAWQLVAVAALVLVLAACGDDDAQPYEDALVESFSNGDADDIGDDGGSELSELGLDEVEAGDLYEAFADCDVDLVGRFTAAFAASNELPPDVAACVAAEFDDDLLRRTMMATIMLGEDDIDQDPALFEDLIAVFEACPGAMED